MGTGLGGRESMGSVSEGMLVEKCEACECELVFSKTHGPALPGTKGTSHGYGCGSMGNAVHAFCKV